jgi:hypothetical protein
MDRFRAVRKALPALALALAACGGSSHPAKPKATAVSAVARRCGLHAAGSDGGFPPGLLPPGAVVTGDGTAIADGRLAAVFADLRARAAAAGLQIGATELETLDAELELTGADGELGLRLGLAPHCARATQVRLAG